MLSNKFNSCGATLNLMQVTPRNVYDIQQADLLITSYLVVGIFTVSPFVLHQPEVTSQKLALVEI
jgi:hypothetical protein